MTTQELIDYYANLLILQYKGKPKAYATIQTLVTPVIMDQLPVQVQDAFNLIGPDFAEGVQLDVLGKYAGVKRSGYGFEGQPITLDDADFVQLIRLGILENSSGSSLAEIQQLLFNFFPGQILVFDYQNMHMSYLISSGIGSQNFLQLAVKEGLLPRPMTVGISYIVFAPVINMFFQFRTYDFPGVNGEPFNTYDVYHMDWPWISYSDTIFI